MRLIKEELDYVYQILRKYGIQGFTARMIIRTIVKFVLENEKYYKGDIKEKTQYLFKAYKEKYTWVILWLRYYGVPNKVINQIIKSVITFVLLNTQYYDDKELEKRVRRINRMIKEKTNIYDIFYSYKVPQKKANKIVKTVIEYTIINKDKYPFLGDYGELTRKILRDFIRDYPYIIDELEGYGMSRQEIRKLLRRIIRFTLRNDYQY